MGGFGDECGENSVSPAEVHVCAMETSRGSNTRATVLFQGSEPHIKVCIWESGSYRQFTEVPLSGLPFLSKMYHGTMSQPSLRQ